MPRKEPSRCIHDVVSQLLRSRHLKVNVVIRHRILHTLNDIIKKQNYIIILMLNSFLNIDMVGYLLPCFFNLNTMFADLNRNSQSILFEL